MSNTTNEIDDDIKALGLEFEFETRKDPADIAVTFIDFKDGRKYKFQHPAFLDVHRVIHEAESANDTFLFALKCLHPNGEKSPEINGAYMDANRHESFFLWSPLARGLLSSS